MLELTPKTLIPLVAELLKFEPPRAVCLVGAPGMAKSESVRQVATQLEAVYIVEHPLLREPVDYAGLPWVQNGEAHQLPMAFVRSVMQAAHDNQTRLVVVFFDDVGQAPAATQAALMQFVQERSFAGQAVPTNVRFVLATNRRRDKAGVGGVLAPLTNRMTVLGVTVDHESWAEWWLGPGGRGAAPQVAAFVRFKPDCLRDPEEHTNRDIEPFCSARSLEAAGRYIAAGIEHNAVIAGAIGDARAVELLAFCKVWRDLPDPAKILRDPNGADLPKANRPDILYALMGALANHVSGKTMSSLGTFLNRLVEAGRPEFAVACVKDAQSQKPELRKTKALLDWLFEHRLLLGVGEANEA